MDPQFTLEVQQAFDSFVHRANKQSPHPLDLWRFNEFLLASLTTGNEVYEATLHEVLKGAGFAERWVSLLSFHYGMTFDLEHLRKGGRPGPR